MFASQVLDLAFVFLNFLPSGLVQSWFGIVILE